MDENKISEQELAIGTALGDYAMENASLKVEKIKLKMKLDVAEQNLKEAESKLDELKEQGIKVD